MQAASHPIPPLDARSADSPDSDDTSLSTLLGGIVSDMQQLLEDHLHLLKLEVQDDLQKSKNAMLPMALGGAAKSARRIQLAGRWAALSSTCLVAVAATSYPSAAGALPACGAPRPSA
jgi:hypothetical protein